MHRNLTRAAAALSLLAALGCGTEGTAPAKPAAPADAPAPAPAIDPTKPVNPTNPAKPPGGF